MFIPHVAIITPTHNTNLNILERCIRSVQWQSYGTDNITHFIFHDGLSKKSQEDFDNSMQINNWKNINYGQLPYNTNSYGAGVRQYVMDNHITEKFDYIINLDDDNILFPDFVKTHVSVLEKHTEEQFSICKIIHLGPLPIHLHPVPAVISGIPPVYRNIDTLQIMVRTSAMKQCSWAQKTGISGYCNDGETYEKLGKMFKWIEIPEILAIHM